MQESSSFGIGTSGQSKGRFLPVLEDQQGVGYLHRVISILQMLPSGSGSPQSAESPGGRLSPEATIGGSIL